MARRPARPAVPGPLPGRRVSPRLRPGSARRRGTAPVRAATSQRAATCGQSVHARSSASSCSAAIAACTPYGPRVRPVMRLAIVAGGTRNARATSAMVSPARHPGQRQPVFGRQRRVGAGEEQQQPLARQFATGIRGRGGSGAIGLHSQERRPGGVGVVPPQPVHRLAPCRRHQPRPGPGRGGAWRGVAWRGGTPEDGQCTNAASMASDATSSARSRSPKRGARAASRRPRSSRKITHPDSVGPAQRDIQVRTSMT